jgi:hypothetical protein
VTQTALFPTAFGIRDIQPLNVVARHSDVWHVPDVFHHKPFRLPFRDDPEVMADKTIPFGLIAIPIRIRIVLAWWPADDACESPRRNAEVFDPLIPQQVRPFDHAEADRFKATAQQINARKDGQYQFIGDGQTGYRLASSSEAGRANALRCDGL